MIVVSDTTAITTLLKAGEERLLRELFGGVFIPQAVWDELIVFHPRLPDFISLRPVAAANQRLSGTELLGRGEVEAIQLAREIDADLLLIDERKGRAIASRFGIKCAGLLAVIVQAKQQGRPPSVQTAIEALERRGSLYLSDEVKAEALRLAGEQQPPKPAS